MRSDSEAVTPMIESHPSSFGSKKDLPIRTRFRIHRVVLPYAALAGTSVTFLAGKRVSHIAIRHTPGVHLLSAAVDTNSIRVWLGHVSFTTHVYAQVDMGMKARPLAMTSPDCRHPHTRQCVPLFDDLPDGPAAATTQLIVWSRPPKTAIVPSLHRYDATAAMLSNT